MIQTKTVGLIGSMPRIGTTTQALQMARYVLQQRHFPAYIEMNDSNYVQKALDLYNAAKNISSSGMVSFAGIEMYSKANLKNAQKKNYDVLIKDYGHVHTDSFEKVSFIEQDIKIVICGSKPNEIFEIEPFLLDSDYDDAFFIFNFSPLEDREYLKEMMRERSDHTFFSGIQTDPFSEIVPDPIYGSILNTA